MQYAERCWVSSFISTDTSQGVSSLSQKALIPGMMGQLYSRINALIKIIEVKYSHDPLPVCVTKSLILKLWL